MTVLCGAEVGRTVEYLPVACCGLGVTVWEDSCMFGVVCCAGLLRVEVKVECYMLDVFDALLTTNNQIYHYCVVSGELPSQGDRFRVLFWRACS